MDVRYQRAACITSPFQVANLKKLVPEPKRGHALIKVLTVGICGSDIPRIVSGKNKVKNLTIGHECVGIVESIDDTCFSGRISVGDRVVVVPILPCYSCAWCRMGEYAHCENYSFLGSREDGALAEYLSIPTQNLIKVHEDMPDSTAVFVEPLSVAVHALLHLNNIQESFAVVIGAGTIGLLVLQLLKLYGAAKVAVFDVVPEKLEIARQFGADYTINPSDLNRIEELKLAMEGFDHSVIIESSNSSSGKSLSLEVSLPKGEIVFVGNLSSPWKIEDEEFQKILRKEVSLKGSWMNYGAPFPGKDWLLAVKLLEEGRVRVKEMITHQFSLVDIQSAVDTLFDPQIVKIKVLVYPEGPHYENV